MVSAPVLCDEGHDQGAVTIVSQNDPFGPQRQIGNKFLPSSRIAPWDLFTFAPGGAKVTATSISFRHSIPVAASSVSIRSCTAHTAIVSWHVTVLHTTTSSTSSDECSTAVADVGADLEQWQGR
jgi:hypothetical protein